MQIRWQRLGSQSQERPTGGALDYRSGEVRIDNWESAMFVVQPVDATQLAEHFEMEEEADEGGGTLIIGILM